MDMNVSVKFRASLKKYAGTKDGTVLVEIPEGTTVKGLLELFGVPELNVGFVVINGKVETRDTVVKDKDEIEILTQLMGG